MVYKYVHLLDDCAKVRVHSHVIAIETGKFQRLSTEVYSLSLSLTHTHTHMAQSCRTLHYLSRTLHLCIIHLYSRDRGEETHTCIFVNIHTLHRNELSVHTWNVIFPSLERVNKQTVCEFDISVLLRNEPQAVMSARFAASSERGLSSSTKITKTKWLK